MKNSLDIGKDFSERRLPYTRKPIPHFTYFPPRLGEPGEGAGTEAGWEGDKGGAKSANRTPRPYTKSKFGTYYTFSR